MTHNRITFLTLAVSLLASLFAGTPLWADLENHYTFDDAASVTNDSSGNNRHGFLDDFEVSWVMDDERGGVLELGGSTSGFMVAPTAELSEFTIMTWAYRDPDLCCGAGGANDGLFQVTFADDDPEFIPPPPTAGTNKVIGGWVQKADGAVWGRLVTDDIVANSLSNFDYFMEDETWVHLAYRGDGQTFELIVNGESGVGPSLAYNLGIADHDSIYVGRQGTETWGGRLDDFRVYSRALTDEEILAIMAGGGGGGPGDPGDFNGNGQLDAEDIELLSAEVRSQTNNVSFDLNNDQLVNDADRAVWVEELKNSYFGDANLDLEFNSGDFVAVFTSGKFETGEAATWAEGDWNGDGVFGSGDFVAAFTAGGYEQGPRAAVAAVPEPTAILMGLLGSCGALLIARRRR